MKPDRDIIPTRREACGVERCEENAATVIKFYTDEGPAFLCFCRRHTLRAVRVLTELHKASTKRT